MKSWTFILILSAILLTGFLAPQAANATTVRKLTFDQLVKKADVIVTGKVLEIENKMIEVNDEKIPYTLVTISTDDVLKGSLQGEEYTFKMRGGRYPGENRYYKIGGMPTFERGQEVCLFLKDNSKLYSPIVGFFQGRFNLITNEKTGRKYVYDNNGVPVTDSFLKTGKHVKDEEPVTYEVFKHLIKYGQGD